MRWREMQKKERAASPTFITTEKRCKVTFMLVIGHSAEPPIHDERAKEQSDRGLGICNNVKLHI